MINDTLSTLETRIQNVSGLSDSDRSEMLELIATLKSEAASNGEAQPQSVHGALQNLSDAISKQEVQHPQITELVNSMSQVLSNTGI
ncbi:MAG: DUF4404 family protein [Planctomycetota bacterium]